MKNIKEFISGALVCLGCLGTVVGFVGTCTRGLVWPMMCAASVACLALATRIGTED